MINDLPKKLVRTRKHPAYKPQPISSTESSKTLPIRSKSISARNHAGKVPVQNDDRRDKKPSTAILPPCSSDSAWEGSKLKAGPVEEHPCVKKSNSFSISTKYVNDEVPKIADAQRRDNTLHDLISSKLDMIITLIDGEEFDGDEGELVITQGSRPVIRGGWGSGAKGVSKGANRAISSAVISTNFFAKANLYANSRLPTHLPPLKIYLPSFPLICLAAQYSQRAYIKPSGKERETHVDANWRLGTKAMVIKSVPIDDINTVIFAIRGSQTFMDWAVNLNSAPVSPCNFLDDPGNLCHSGFLSVARRMIHPVAARLRSLLEEDPSRCDSSLLITGHSAGGAIASLLYAHMLAEDVSSELTILASCFKRIHCISFGAPPISLLPLTKPLHLRRGRSKSLFLAFINEGDPVPRADKAYVRSLLDLYLSPLPPSRIWPVPPGTLSNAGSLVLLRASGRAEDPNADEDNVNAMLTTDAQLREVVFGNPIMHMMKRYARRVEVLATNAVTMRV